MVNFTFSLYIPIPSDGYLGIIYTEVLSAYKVNTLSDMEIDQLKI